MDDVIGRDLSFFNIEINDGVNIEHIDDYKLIDAQNAKIKGHFYANGTNIRDTLHMQDATIQGDLNIENTEIGNNLFAPDLIVEGNMNAHNTQIGDGIYSPHTQIDGDLILSESKVNHTSLYGIKIDGTLDASKAELNYLNLHDAIIGGSLNLDNAFVTGDIYLNNAHISTLQMNQNTRIYDRLELSGAHIDHFEGKLAQNDYTIVLDTETYESLPENLQEAIDSYEGEVIFS